MTEQQPFELVQRYPHFELRRYPAHVVAEIQVNATFDRAGNAAFRQLFNYISGSNNVRQKMAMTAPVIQEPGPSRKLAMTAPVLQGGPLPGREETADFVVAFVLPAGLTAETAPVPANSQIKIRSIPGSLTAVGPPRFARFDPPFKPWFLRRNEVVQDVQEHLPPSGEPGP